MEGAMERYVIAKRDHHWVVSVNGSELMYCKEKRTAVQMAKVANHRFRSEIVTEKEAEVTPTDIH
jgi:hypothetical protein